MIDLKIESESSSLDKKPCSIKLSSSESCRSRLSIYRTECKCFLLNDFEIEKEMKSIGINPENTLFALKSKLDCDIA